MLIEPSNRAILVVSSKEMLPPLPSVDSVFYFCVIVYRGVKLCGRTKIFICIPEVKNELEHRTGPTMVDSLCLLYVMLVCVSFSFFCIVVSSLNVFIVDCFVFFGVMKKSVGSIYASGQ